MKRPISWDRDVGDAAGVDDLNQTKKSKIEAEESEKKVPKKAEDVLMDENLLYEVMQHVDARTLAWAACVCKRWNRTAQDERLWELMCVRDGSRCYHQQQLRTVVRALGGFRRLYSLHLWPIVKFSSLPSTSGSNSTWPSLPAPPVPAAPTTFAAGKTPLGKDEMNLSLSLFSIQYFASLKSSNRKK